MKILVLLSILVFFNACDSSNGSKNTPTINTSTIETTNPLPKLPDTKDVLVLRTDFSSNAEWEKISNLIAQSGNELGFEPHVDYLSESSFEGLDKNQLLKTNRDYRHHFIFLADSISMKHTEHPILCVDLYADTSNSFRVVPSEVWAVENNLSISNIDFEEFLYSMNNDGIFRGFKK